MTRKQFEQFFKTEIEGSIPANDKPALRQAWNDTVDSMMRDGSLPARAGDWSHPARFYAISEKNKKTIPPWHASNLSSFLN